MREIRRAGVVHAVSLCLVLFFAASPLRSQGGSPNTESGLDSFQAVSEGDGTFQDGTRFNFNTVKNRSGITVTFASASFRSPAAALNQVQRETRLANGVLEENDTLAESSGEVVGKRVLLEFVDKKSGKHSFLVIWTHGASFYSITSPSKAVVLAFEERDRADRLSANHIKNRQ